MPKYNQTRFPERDARIYELWKGEGLSLTTIAKRHGLSVVRVRQIIERECRRHGTVYTGYKNRPSL